MGTLLGEIRVNIEIAEITPEDHQPLVAQMLIAEEDHEMGQPGAADFGDLRRGKIG